MNYSDAIEAVKSGKKVKLPEWTGYWFRSADGRIMVFTADCKVLDTPFTTDYTQRTDWQITDGNRDFGGALKAIRAGKAVRRAGWNGKGMFLTLQKGSVGYDGVHGDDNLPKGGHHAGVPNELFESGDSGTVTRMPNINMRAAGGETVVGWLASQTDMLAEDWQVVEE